VADFLLDFDKNLIKFIEELFILITGECFKVLHCLQSFADYFVKIKHLVHLRYFTDLGSYFFLLQLFHQYRPA